MGRYVARRLVQFIPIFLGVTFLVFAAVYLLPGDPIRALIGPRPVSDAVIDAMRAQYHLDDPLHVQYGRYMTGVLSGDLGTDLRGRPVTDILQQRIPITLRLAGLAFTFEVLLGLSAGIIAGLRHRTFADTLILVSTTAVVAVPIFVMGFVAQITFGIGLGPLGIFPLTYDPSRPWFSLVLPALVLASITTAYLSRVLRASLLETMRAEYVRMARAKGMTGRRVIGRHVLRNSLLPLVTLLGVDIGGLIGGTVIIEGIFNIPGIGLEVFLAIRQHESAVVVGIATALVLVFLVVSLLVDLLYAVLDPRIRLE